MRVVLNGADAELADGATVREAIETLELPSEGPGGGGGGETPSRPRTNG